MEVCFSKIPTAHEGNFNLVRIIFWVKIPVLRLHVFIFIHLLNRSNIFHGCFAFTTNFCQLSSVPAKITVLLWPESSFSHIEEFSKSQRNGENCIRDRKIMFRDGKRSWASRIWTKRLFSLDLFDITNLISFNRLFTKQMNKAYLCA